jgi:hypothetical protein
VEENNQVVTGVWPPAVRYRSNFFKEFFSGLKNFSAQKNPA